MVDDRGRTTILLVHGRHPLLTGAIAMALEADPSFEVIGAPCPPEAAVDAVGRRRPRLALVDVRGDPPVRAGSVARELIEASPFTRVVLIAGTGDDDRVVVEAARAGAVAVVDEGHDMGQFADELASIGEGRLPALRPPTERAERRVAQDREILRRVSTLTSRESDILTLLLEGRRTADIAALLRISTRTVETHVHHLLGKLGVGSRLEAVIAVAGALPVVEQVRGTT